ncbi:hypothetical protein CBOM_02117 [Ceraceosorus bombacis]|uniref:UspA domain-containing protein n=1 Tax=Ceraceosorus bombacis TaxID=401625 RepID=A0A0P1BEH0_9BASI|nr:hypothetical protein CBOM_02117 [Ceraceosorus bombacis]
MSKPAPISTDAANAGNGTSPSSSVPTSPSTTRKLGNALASMGIGTKKQSADGLTTPTHEIAQTPALESGNPFDKHDIPTEARQQLVVGKVGEAIHEENSKILLALDGTDAGDKAFNYVLNSKVLAKDAHIFIATVLPANVLSGPWVSGPLSIDTKRQNELLKQLRTQALAKLQPYKEKLKAAGYEATLHILHGDARQSLVRVAQHHKVDLVIAGKRTAKKGLNFSTGTISSHLVNHAPSPVLVIK